MCVWGGRVFDSLYSDSGCGTPGVHPWTGSAPSPALPRILRFPGTGQGMAPSGGVGWGGMGLAEGGCSSSGRPGVQRTGYEECSQAGPVKGLGG